MSDLASTMTGVYFASLQVGTLLAVQSVGSAAWPTYAGLTAAWLAGTLVGLWLPLPRRAAIAAGLLAFEAMIALTRLWPWSRALVPVAALSIAIGGLWAGGFFTSAARRGKDRSVFFDENNGFLLGLVVTTVAFAFAGRGGLAALTLVTGGALFGLERTTS
ncbi:MAG: hypothetical protein KIT84_16600 [Labilithrix sp.]|nr:hypothetical protein [Labilithrix sp.]MCW5812651.1 hypothetical protein [Labilithrix sp.]